MLEDEKHVIMMQKPLNMDVLKFHLNKTIEVLRFDPQQRLGSAIPRS